MIDPVSEHRPEPADARRDWPRVRRKAAGSSSCSGTRRHRPRRGPKPRISLAEIVSAGIAIADAEGLESLSMRKVAQQLGVGAMSLYTYVPGRSELMELMIDAVYGEHRAARHRSHLAGPGGALEPRDLADLRRAPMAAGLQHGPTADRSTRAGCRGGAVRRAAAAGFTGAQNVAVSNLIQWQLLGAARATISDADEARHTGISTEAYWESRASFWVTYFDPARFPAMARCRRPAASTTPPAGTSTAAHPAAGRDRAAAPRAERSGRAQRVRLGVVAVAEDAPVEVLVGQLGADHQHLPVRAPILLAEHRVHHVDRADPADLAIGFELGLPRGRRSPSTPAAKV